MFSQVLLKFKDGTKKWFSNTTLEEVTKDGGRKLITPQEVLKSILVEYKRIVSTRNQIYDDCKPFTSPGGGWSAMQWKLDELVPVIKEGRKMESSSKVKSLMVLALRFIIDIGNKEIEEE